MDLNLKDRVAVVTGAGSGIGEGIARALAAEGCKLSILDRDASAAQKTASSLTGTMAQSTAVDVGDSAAVERVFAETIATFGRLDILVNAAGVLSTGLVADLPVTEWQRIAQVNLAGVIYCVKAAIPVMKRQRHGRIINIASVSAMRGGGSVGNTLYGTTKAGVVALTMGLARELGPFGITANAIAPAVVDTAMTHAALTEDAKRRILERIPLGRLARLSDIADLAAFLASDRAGFVTGATIPVDGGILTT
ncbi:MAG: SDR family oxidoreductase [Bradyrhizobium sp.]|uniref:SDR family NAD(P)-dependent oxidoreductase n=1 Tax=Bradyrhizobium sp. TaxID=376 RepID=UPI00122594D9|nr:SDR family NAD(P)-dependent oxidoreductase [Bradyrhizobium sp.]THD68697.1 MAG: SDR family oxidoreductase [Bradyrhizobium sp.]